MKKLTFEEWRVFYGPKRELAYSLEVQRLIKKGLFELNPDDVDRMLEFVHPDHIKRYRAVI